MQIPVTASFQTFKNWPKVRGHESFRKSSTDLMFSVSSMLYVYMLYKFENSNYLRLFLFENLLHDIFQSSAENIKFSNLKHFQIGT